jgi:hypothetical protein
MAAFQSLLGLTSEHGPTTYNMLYVVSKPDNQKAHYRVVNIGYLVLLRKKRSELVAQGLMAGRQRYRICNDLRLLARSFEK